MPSFTASVVGFGVIIVVSALLIFLKQFLDLSWQTFPIAAAAMLLLVLAVMWKRGIFLSPWSLQLRSINERYRYAGLIPILQELKSRKRRRVEVLKGVIFVLIALVIGFSIDLLQSYLLSDLQLKVDPGLIATTWQTHAVIIGFSFVALTFVWEEIYSNPLSDELTRLFIEDIGSIWTVTFVFGANLSIGITSFSQSSAQTADSAAVYVTAVLFVSSIIFVAWRFLDALDLLFYADLDEELKQYAAKDLEREIVSEQSTPNEILSKSVTGFDHLSLVLPDFNVDRTVISSRDIDKRGVITDLNLKRMKRIGEIVDEAQTASIEENPAVGRSLAEDTTVLSLEGDISDEALHEIEQQLRRGIRTRGGA